MAENKFPLINQFQIVLNMRLVFKSMYYTLIQLLACMFFRSVYKRQIKDPNFPVLIARVVGLRYKCQHRQLVNIQKFASSSLSACSISQVKYTYLLVYQVCSIPYLSTKLVYHAMTLIGIKYYANTGLEPFSDFIFETFTYYVRVVHSKNILLFLTFGPELRIKFVFLQKKNQTVYAAALLPMKTGSCDEFSLTIYH